MGIKGKRILSVLLLIGFAAVIAMLSGAGRGRKVHTKDLFAMDTYFSMKAYGRSAEKALALAADRVRELESELSVTAEGSDVWRINHAENGGENRVEDQAEDRTDNQAREQRVYVVSEDTYRLAKEAIRLGDETDGALDITLYPVLRKWGFTTGEYRIPSQEEIGEALQYADYRRVVPKDGEAWVLAVSEGTELDFGAVAKGYTGDSILEILRKEGVTSAILDLGGNVQTLGTKPDGSYWKVGVKNPFDPGEELGVLEVADKAVITSGGYERYFVGEDGERYWHILDPADGYPADGGLVSMTIVGDSGTVCDGLSTALFVMGREKAVEFWRKRQDFEMILVTQDGQLYVTEGISGRFQCADGWQAEAVILRNVK